MTDQPIDDGAGPAGDEARTDDARARAEARFNDIKGKAKDAYGRAIDGLDKVVDKAPADLQEPARRGLDFARRKPLLTTGILAGLAVLLASSGRRR